MDSLPPETHQSQYVDKLRDLYSAESQLARMLPKMAKAASTSLLRDAFTDHLHQTQVHVHRLDVIFSRLGVGPKGGDCTEMETMIAEVRHRMGGNQKPAEIDAAMIDAVGRFERFEAPIYESLQTSAQQLGHVNSAASLQESLNEKIASDKRMGDMAVLGATAADRASRGKAAPRSQVK